jgi:trans-2,3-dihydro-3-hydroxyanthranilate isomerase
MRHLFFITDVFADQKYRGNQLATFLYCDDLSTEQMQRMAREINFSESTFVMKPKGDAPMRVRIFTPQEEVDFAGHPTLGTAFVIDRHVRPGAGGKVILDLNVGNIPVTFSDESDILWMRQNQPEFGNDIDGSVMAAVLGLEKEDLDGSCPCQEVSTGLKVIIVPLAGKDALRRMALARDWPQRLDGLSRSKVILAFCRGGQEEGQELSVRVFPMGVGIAEDPATGSGNGCLAAYLVRHECLGDDQVDIQVGQGYEMGRPSRLFLRARPEGSGIRVEVGGRVHQVAEGWWDEDDP